MEADEYRKVLDGAVAISETSMDIEDKYRELPKAEIERLNKVLPDNVDGVRLALDLDGIAARYGISLKKVQVDRQLDDNSGVISVGDTGPYEMVNVTFTFVSLSSARKTFVMPNIANLLMQYDPPFS